MTNSYTTALKTLGIAQSDRKALLVLSIVVQSCYAENRLEADQKASETFGQFGSDVVGITWDMQQEARDLVLYA
jgi:hypothetical protein